MKTRTHNKHLKSYKSMCVRTKITKAVLVNVLKRRNAMEVLKKAYANASRERRVGNFALS
jgi:hypothetical protein